MPSDKAVNSVLLRGIGKVFTGEHGGDTFALGSSFGKDTITDFRWANDRIQSLGTTLTADSFV